MYGGQKKDLSRERAKKKLRGTNAFTFNRQEHHVQIEKRGYEFPGEEAVQIGRQSPRAGQGIPLP